jgi:hypothetical protein
MQAVHILGAVLALQAQALGLGAHVEDHLERTQAALCAQVEGLVPREPPAPPPPAAAPQPTGEAVPSAWDPEPHDVVLEASKCRALLLEVIRRAAHDWVLYRSTRRPERAFALDAYVWLFEEEPGHPNWELRKREGEPMLAFLTICDLLDLEPETVRARVRGMTIRDIMTAGRPAERRRAPKSDGVEDYSSPRQLDVVSYDDPEVYSTFAVAACY